MYTWLLNSMELFLKVFIGAQKKTKHLTYYTHPAPQTTKKKTPNLRNIAKKVIKMCSHLDAKQHVDDYHRECDLSSRYVFQWNEHVHEAIVLIMVRRKDSSPIIQIWKTLDELYFCHLFIHNTKTLHCNWNKCVMAKFLDILDLLPVRLRDTNLGRFTSFALDYLYGSYVNFYWHWI